jgi:hypothetical protein
MRGCFSPAFLVHRSKSFAFQMNTWIIFVCTDLNHVEDSAGGPVACHFSFFFFQYFTLNQSLN